MSTREYILHTASRCIDPLFISKIRSVNNVKTVIQYDGSVSVFNTTLVFGDNSNALEPGTPVNVYLGSRSFCCISIAEYEEDRKEREAVQQAEDDKRRAKLNAYKE